ncbi:MAG: hypothetical protein SVV80_00805 [Planctomycetota bacterium]|nr:hypothetical protein [Planctomycetota bacterium]
MSDLIAGKVSGYGVFSASHLLSSAIGQNDAVIAVDNHHDIGRGIDYGLEESSRPPQGIFIMPLFCDISRRGQCARNIPVVILENATPPCKEAFFTVSAMLPTLNVYYVFVAVEKRLDFFISILLTHEEKRSLFTQRVNTEKLKSCFVHPCVHLVFVNFRDDVRDSGKNGLIARIQRIQKLCSTIAVFLSCFFVNGHGFTFRRERHIVRSALPKLQTSEMQYSYPADDKDDKQATQ